MALKSILYLLFVAVVTLAVPVEKSQQESAPSTSVIIQMKEETDNAPGDGEPVAKEDVIVNNDATNNLRDEEYEGHKSLPGIDSSEYSVPSWYVDALLTDMPNDEAGIDPTIEHYGKELSDMISNMKLYQLFRSIKSLKIILNELIGDKEPLKNESDETDGPGTPKGNGEENDGVNDVVIDPHVSQMIADAVEDEHNFIGKNDHVEQLESLTHKNQRRVKRDLGWNNFDFSFDDPDMSSFKIRGKNFISNPDTSRNNPTVDQSFVSFDIDLDENGESDITNKLRKLFPGVQFDPKEFENSDDYYLQFGDDHFNPYWTRSRRSYPQSQMKDYIQRLPTLEGMRKRNDFAPRPQVRKPMKFRSSDISSMSPNERLRTYRSIEKMARKMAENPRRRRQSPVLKYDEDTDDTAVAELFSDGSPGDINFWYQEKPRYTIGIGQNIDNPQEDWDLNFPEYNKAEEQPMYLYNEFGAQFNENEMKTKRSTPIREYPSLPGPYQGYYMEGQLFHQFLDKRNGKKRRIPKLPSRNEVQIAGPNAWGNFIFIDGGNEVADLGALDTIDHFLDNTDVEDPWSGEITDDAPDKSETSDRESYYKILNALLKHPAFSGSRTQIDK